MSGDEVEIQFDDRACPICARPLLFSARMVVELEWVDEQTITTRRTVWLCSHCHRDRVGEQGLLAFFAFHERITDENLDEAAVLIRDWLSTVTTTDYTDEQLAEDIRRWEAGEM